MLCSAGRRFKWFKLLRAKSIVAIRSLVGQGHGLLEHSLLQPSLHQDAPQTGVLLRENLSKRRFASTWLQLVAELGMGLQDGPQLWLQSWASSAGAVCQGNEDDTKHGGVTDMPDVCAGEMS